jgi:DMSO reductase anchor subunit
MTGKAAQLDKGGKTVQLSAGPDLERIETMNKENAEHSIPGSMVIMVVYLVIFTLGFILSFAHLGTKWPIG